MSNTFDNATTFQDEDRGQGVIVLLAIILVIFIFLSISGNILVVMAVLKMPQLKEEKSNLLVINLAITDMANGCTVMLSTFVSLVTDTHSTEYVLCNIICATNYCLIIVSMMTLCFISIDRLYAIVFPLHYVERITTKVIFAAITWSWIQGLAFSIAPIIKDWIQYDYWEITCAIQWHKEGKEAIYYVIVAFIFCFLIPGIILAVNYFKILKEAREKMKIWAVTFQTTKDKNIKSKVKKQSASAKTVSSLLIVVCAYFICLTPFSVTKLIKVSVEEPIIPGFVNSIASLFAFGSSVVNPLIYGIFRKDFRRAFSNIIRKKKAIYSNTIRGTVPHMAETSFSISN